MKNIPADTEFIKNISIAAKKNRLTLFIGAGISKTSNCPSWSSLINSIQQELTKIDSSYIPYTTLSVNDFLTIPQKYYYALNCDNTKYYKFLSSALNLSNASPNTLHNLILSLNPTYLITTNFDNLLEQAILNNNLSFSIIAKDEDFNKIDTNKILIKAHGDIQNKNIVLKEEDYLNYHRNFKNIETLIKTLFSTTTVVFIGYSISDYNIKLMLNDIKHLNSNNIYLLYLDPEKLSDLEINYYKSRGITIINYNDFTKDIPHWYLKYQKALLRINYLSKNIHKTETSYTDIKKQIRAINKLNALRFEDFNQILKPILKLNIEDICTFTTSSFMNTLKLEIPEELINYRPFHSLYSKVCIVPNNYKGLISQCNYENIKTLMTKDALSLNDKYIKAFYLVFFKKYNKATNLYKEVAYESLKSKNYLLHYLSNINLFLLSKHNDTSISLAEPKKLFNQLPADFTLTFISLKNICDTSYIESLLLEATNILSIYSNRNHTNSPFISNNPNAYRNSLSNSIKFYLTNHILLGLPNQPLNLSISKNFRKYIKQTLEVIIIEHFFHNKTILPYNKFIANFMKSSKRDIFIHTDEFLYFIYYFSSRDLRGLFQEYPIFNLKFKNTTHIINILSIIAKNYNHNSSYKEFLTNALILLGRSSLSLKEFKAILNVLFSNINIPIKLKTDFIAYQAHSNLSGNTKAAEILSHFLAANLDNILTTITIYKDNLQCNICDLAYYINQISDTYRSHIINDKIKKLLRTSPVEINPFDFIKLSLILPKDTSDIILNLVLDSFIKTENINILILLVNLNLLKHVDDYVLFLKRNIEKDKESLGDKFDEHLDYMATNILYLVKDKSCLFSLKGISPITDLILDPNNFDYTKLNASWFLNSCSNIKVNKYLAKYPIAKKNIEECILNELKNKKLVYEQKENLLDLYIKVYK